jgi:hypothetical protein
MKDEIVLVLAVLIIFAVAIFIVIREIIKARRLKDSFSKIGRALNPDNPGSVTRSKLTGNIQGTVLLDGVECIYGYTPPTRGSRSRRPGVFKISLGCQSDGEFTIRAEGTMDRLGKKIGIASEVQTHDADFDGRFYIDSSDREFVSAFFASPESREAIRSLFDLGFEAAVHDGKTMAVQWTGYERLEEFNAEFVKEAILYLTALIGELPEPSSIGGLRGSYGASEKSSGGRIKLGILYVVPFIAIAVMAGVTKENQSFRLPIDFMPLFFFTLRYSLPGLVFYVLFSMKVIRIGASSHRRILSLSSVSLVSFLIVGIQLGTHLNVTQNPGPARVHTVQVAKKPSRGPRTPLPITPMRPPGRQGKKPSNWTYPRGSTGESLPAARALPCGPDREDWGSNGLSHSASRASSGPVRPSASPRSLQVPKREIWMR